MCSNAENFLQIFWNTGTMPWQMMALVSVLWRLSCITKNSGAVIDFENWSRVFWKTRQTKVSFLFPDQQGSGSATKGVFTYFFWVLLQPFRGNPEYHDVADLPYNSSCLNDIKTDRTDMRSLSKFFFSSHIYVEIDFLRQ